MDARNRIIPVRGLMVAETRDGSGRLVDLQRIANTYTHAYAALHASALAGQAPNLSLSSIGLGTGGRMVSACDVNTSWASAPTVDTSTFRQGVASLQGTTALSTSTTYANANILTPDYDATSDTHVEVWLRLLLRGRFNLTSSKVMIYTGSSSANHYDVTLDGIETINGVSFQDGVWKLCRIPKASFTGVGSPNWNAVSGAGVIVAANSSGTATLNWDEVRVYNSAPDLSVTQEYLPSEMTRKAVSELTLVDRVATASAYWTVSEGVGQYYCAGLFGNGGNTLCSILPFTYTKLPGYSLRVSWSLTTSGG